MGTLAWDAGSGKWAVATGGDCLARMSGSCERYQHFGVSCVGGRLGRGARRRGRWIGRSCLGRRGRLYVLLQRLVCPAVVEVSKPLRRDKSGLECVIRSIDGPTRARHRTAGSRQRAVRLWRRRPHPIISPNPTTSDFDSTPLSSTLLSLFLFYPLDKK